MATVSPFLSCRSGSAPFFRSSSVVHIGSFSSSLTSTITYWNGSREPSRTLSTCSVVAGSFVGRASCPQIQPNGSSAYHTCDEQPPLVAFAVPLTGSRAPLIALPTIGDDHGPDLDDRLGRRHLDDLDVRRLGRRLGRQVGRHVGLDVVGLERHARDDVDRMRLPRLGVSDEWRRDQEGHDDGTHREDRSTARRGPLHGVQ